MKIIILGAGIAGLSSAIALTQAGFTVDIYERRSHAANIGAGIVCWPNASFVLQQLGVLDQVTNCAGTISAMQRFDAQGNLLNKIDIQALNQKMGFESYSITRFHIIDILLQKALSLGVAIHFNSGVKQIEEQDKQAALLLDNGKKVTGDIIIGADGRMNSKARRYVNNGNKTTFQHFINWIGIFEQNALNKHVALFDELSVCDYWGQGERFGIVPINKTHAYWAGGIYTDTIGTKNPEAYHQELLSVFSHWPTPIKSIIENTPTNKINKLYIHDHDPINCWYKNNVILIGDAAHAALPTSGQGACQALEDAWHLAQCLQQKPLEIQEAFASFQRQRQEKTTAIINVGRQLAHSIFTPDQDIVEKRNQSAKALSSQQAVAGMAQLWSQGLPLPFQ